MDRLHRIIRFEGGEPFAAIALCVLMIVWLHVTAWLYSLFGLDGVESLKSNLFMAVAWMELTGFGVMWLWGFLTYKHPRRPNFAIHVIVITSMVVVTIIMTLAVIIGLLFLGGSAHAAASAAALFGTWGTLTFVPAIVRILDIVFPCLRAR